MREKIACRKGEQSTEYRKGVVNVTYIDRLNQFYRHLVYNDLPPHAQLTYLHLLNVANQLGWQEKFCITDRRLETLTGLSSKAIADAKRILKDRFVTINTNKKKPRQGSCYSLLNLLHSIESKTESKKESKREGKTESKIGGKPDSLPSISISKIKEEERDTDGAGVCDALNTAIKTAWGDGLDWNNSYDLGALQEQYGVDAVVKAINAAKNSLKGRPLTVPYLRGTLERMNQERSDENVQKNRKSNAVERNDDDINAQYYNLR